MAKKLRPEPLTDQEKLAQADYEWPRQDSGVRARYAGQVVAVCGRKVIAAGKSLAELKRLLERRDDFFPNRIVVIPVGV
jgi:hypothetical protein